MIYYRRAPEFPRRRGWWCDPPPCWDGIDAGYLSQRSATVELRAHPARADRQRWRRMRAKLTRMQRVTADMKAQVARERRRR